MPISRTQHTIEHCDSHLYSEIIEEPKESVWRTLRTYFFRMNHSFDSTMGVEAAFHCFMREKSRCDVLKPGGMLVLSDVLHVRRT